MNLRFYMQAYDELCLHLEKLLETIDESDATRSLMYDSAPGLWLGSVIPGKFGAIRIGARMSEPCLSADDIAEHLGVAKNTLYAWIANKGTPARKVGRL